MNAIQNNTYKKLTAFFEKITTKKIRLKVSEWAEKHRYLPSELSPDPGHWRNDRAPYNVEIMDCFSQSSPVERVAVMKGTQVGATVGVLENAIGYSIDVDPCAMMYMNADKSLAETGIELRIDRMIDTVENLKDRIRPGVEKRHSKKTGDTKSKKEFAGGFMTAVGARSAGKLRMFSMRKLFIDEIDGMPLDVQGEGDPVSLAEQRTKNFPNRKVLYISTPTIKQTSRIEPLYMLGDMRRWLMPCPHCQQYQILHFFIDKKKNHSGLHYEVDEHGRLAPDSVRYKCEHCDNYFFNRDKINMLKQGYWQPTPDHKPADKHFRSYYIEPIFSPWYPWENLVSAWLSAKNNVDKMRTFWNTELGLPWEERGEAPIYENVIMHRRMYAPGTIPNKIAINDGAGPILLLTAAVDTQDNGFYCEVKGWCKHGTSFSIDFKFFEGDTAKPEVYEQLRNYLLNKEFRSDDGKAYFINFATIDAGGHRTEQIYKHCESYSNQTFFVPLMGQRHVKRANAHEQPWKLQKPKENHPNLMVFYIDTTHYKNDISRRFKQSWRTGEEMPAGWLNFAEYGDDYFKQYTAEQFVMEKDKKTGQTRSMYWRQIGNRPNHAFDCCVYNMFALDIFAHMFCVGDDALGLDQLDWQAFWDYFEKNPARK